MKIFKFLAIALVAMVGLNSCSKDCDHEFIEHDHSADLVGTWTCLTENYAEALIIKADGTAVSYGVENGKYWENVKGSVTVKDNNITMIFEDDDNWTGHFDVIPGMAFSLFEENGERYIYNYCKEDLSEKIVGMWVCNDFTTNGDADMMIETFYENGKSTLTGLLPMDDNYEQILNGATDYQVVGDLLFITIPAEKVDGKNPLYVADKLIYTPDGTAHGDILTMITYPKEGGSAATSSWLRVKQHLNLDGKVYDYNSAYVSNAKGKDEDFTIGESTFNMSNIKGGDFDMMFRAVLSCFEFSANSFTYKFRSNDMDIEFATPITVDGNKVTLDMSKMNPACRTVVMHMFQDKDDSQLHMYMHTDAFINYFANVEVATLIAMGEINQTDEAAIAKVFADMEARVESINVSFVLKARK